MDPWRRGLKAHYVMRNPGGGERRSAQGEPNLDHLGPDLLAVLLVGWEVRGSLLWKLASIPQGWHDA